jgi:hypothetical protein
MIWKPEGKGFVFRQKSVLKYGGNIEMSLEEVGFEGVDWLFWLRGQQQEHVRKINKQLDP